jgi:thiamine-monophosphate kinase
LAAGWPGAFGLSDDAAIIAPTEGCDLVVTTDTMVAGVHFVGDEPAALIARKLLRVNLSDLAGMGATALCYTLNLALPSSTGDAWLADFTGGLAADQAEFAVALAGGDSVSIPGPVCLTVTAFGEVTHGAALRRKGARPGDRIFVTGTIGDGALGLRAVKGELPALDGAAREWLADRYRLPRPRLDAGTRLAGLATAGMDISDGLVGDLGHITDVSGVAAVVDSALVPLSDAVLEALAGTPDLREVVLTGGDDYELMFTAPAEAGSAITALSETLGLPMTEIGRIEAGGGVRVLDGQGQPLAFAAAGYTHR